MVLTIWWCPCVESSLVLLEEGVCYYQCILLAELYSFCPASFGFQDQTWLQITPGISWLSTFAFHFHICTDYLTYILKKMKNRSWNKHTYINDENNQHTFGCVSLCIQEYFLYFIFWYLIYLNCNALKKNRNTYFKYVTLPALRLPALLKINF